MSQSLSPWFLLLSSPIWRGLWINPAVSQIMPSRGVNSIFTKSHHFFHHFVDMAYFCEGAAFKFWTIVSWAIGLRNWHLWPQYFSFLRRAVPTWLHSWWTFFLVIVLMLVQICWAFSLSTFCLILSTEFSSMLRVSLKLHRSKGVLVKLVGFNNRNSY